MINFCTLFDSNYLTRGLALYQSLQSVCKSFHLYVIAFNNASYEYLSKAGLPSLTVISLTEFEDNELLKVKPTRSVAEYCWTCTPSAIAYCIKNFNLPSCTYVDADMIFYSDPQILLDETGEKSVMITEHRYSPAYNQAIGNGIYCVQFMYFKNTPAGMEVLNWWRERCIEWCYDRLEDGKFGDQKYLDDWPARFNAVHVLQHQGGGVAPWNVQQYDFENTKENFSLFTKQGHITYPVVFYHFHGLKFYTDETVSLAGSLYEINASVKRSFYFPYIKQLQSIEKQLRNEGITFNINGATKPSPAKSAIFKGLAREKLSLLKHGRISLFQSDTYNIKNHYHFHKINSLE